MAATVLETTGRSQGLQRQNMHHYIPRLFIFWLLFVFFSSLQPALFGSLGLLSSSDAAHEDWVSRIKKVIQDRFDRGSIEFDYMKTKSGEICLLLDEGLFFSNLRSEPLTLEPLIPSSLSPVRLVQVFETASRTVLLFQQNQMNHGIVTDRYSILEMSSEKASAEKSCYELYGFEADTEDGGENGIETGMNVEKVFIRVLRPGEAPSIIFRVESHTYDTGRKGRSLLVFKEISGAYRLFQEQKVLSAW